MSPTDLDQWRTLSPKDFTAKLLTLAEEHSDILPEKAYVGLMNATKVIHERTCREDEEEHEPRGGTIIDRLASSIIELKQKREEANELYRKYNGFKYMKNMTKKIKEEAILCYALNRCGVTLPVASFKSLEYHCGIYIEPARQDGFFNDYLAHRNRLMSNLREEYSHVSAYIDDRIEYFTSCYERCFL